MSGINYVGNAMNGFQQGRQLRQDMDTQKAMSALVGNPQDANAMQMLAGANPQMAMQMQQQQAQQRKTQLEEANQKLTMTMQLLGSARDEQSYQLAKQRGAQMGLDISSAPPTYDPNWVQSTAQQALALQGKAQQELSGLMREFQDYSSLPPQGQQQMQQFMQMRYPGMQSPLIIPNNVQQVGGPGVGGGGQAPTATGPNGEKVQWNGSAWVPMGGSGGNAGGGFLGPL